MEESEKKETIFTYQVPEFFDGKNDDGTPEKVPSKMRGTIGLKKPKAPERFRLMSKCKFKFDDKAELQAAMKDPENVAMMLEVTEPFFRTVDVKSEDGTEYKSLDDLSVDGRCLGILMDVASLLINGFKVGEA